MAINSADIQKLRAESGAGIMDCKKALEEANGDIKKASEVLKEKGAMIAAKKAERQARQGLVETYVHGKGQIGVMVEVNCETDFVARNPEFKELAHDIALQISAMAPKTIEELMKQDYVKDPSVTIEALVTGKIAKIGENIQIRRFERYALGE